MILFASWSEGYARVVSSWEIPSPVHVAIEQWMGTWGPSHIPIPMHAQARQPPHIPSGGNEHTLFFPASKQANKRKKKQEKFMRKNAWLYKSSAKTIKNAQTSLLFQTSINYMCTYQTRNTRDGQIDVFFSLEVAIC
jgi:hypothetical protein